MNNEWLEKLVEDGAVKLWENHGMIRYYFQNGDLRKAGVFFQEDKSKSRYHFKHNSGWIHANKCYNGHVQKQLTDMLKVEVNF